MQSFKSYLIEGRVDTTLNASITELFPTLAFNLKIKRTQANTGMHK